MSKIRICLCTTNPDGTVGLYGYKVGHQYPFKTMKSDHKNHNFFQVATSEERWEQEYMSVSATMFQKFFQPLPLEEPS